jgi:hypothetical protein
MHQGPGSLTKMNRGLTGGPISDADVLEHVRVDSDGRSGEHKHDGAGRGDIGVDPCHDRSLGTG